MTAVMLDYIRMVDPQYRIGLPAVPSFANLEATTFSPEAVLVSDMTRTGIGASLGAPREGLFIPSWLQDHWLDTFFAPGSSVDLSFISGTVTTPVTVQSLYRESQTLQQVTYTGSVGVTLNHAETGTLVRTGDQWDPFETVTLQLMVSEEVPPVVDTTIRLFFDGGFTLFFSVSAIVSVVWPIPPDWVDGVTESREYKTSVLQSRNGKEQRIESRISPRLSIAYTVGTVDSEHALLLYRLLADSQSQTFLLPMWHAPVRLLLADGVRIQLEQAISAVDTLVVWASTTSYEVVSVESASGDSVFLSAPLAGVYTDAIVYPAVECRISDSVQGEMFTGASLSVPVSFRTEVGPPLPEQAPARVFLGLPFPDIAVTWSDTPAVTLSRLQEVIDYEHGRVEVTDLADQNYTALSATVVATDEDEITALYALIEYLRGRLRPIWVRMPIQFIYTVDHFQEGGATLVVDQMPYEQLNETNSNLYITTAVGPPQTIKITGQAAHSSGGVSLISANAFEYSADRQHITGCQAMRLCRLRSDQVSLHYHTPGYIETKIELITVPDQEAVQAFAAAS